MSMDSHTTSNATSSSSLSFDVNDFQQGNFGDTDNPRMIRWKSGKKVDPRLIVLLHLFQELYVERRELFKKIFPDVHQMFVDLFKRIGEGLPKKDQVKVMQRSLSIGSPSTRQQVEEPELSLHRFKVRTPVLTGAPPGGGGQTTQSQTTTTSNVTR